MRQWVHGMLMLAMVPASILANEMGIDFSSEISKLRAAQTVKLVLISPTIVFRTPPDEATLLGQGCIIITQDRSRIAELVDILSRTDMSAREPDFMRQEARNGIYFELPGGTQRKFIFGENHGGHYPVRGEFNGVTMNIGETLPHGLRTWMLGLTTADPNALKGGGDCQYGFDDSK